MSIILAILIFSLIVIIHELGHFLLAKRNGIVVEEFSVGMGPRIVSTVKGGTRYSWKLLPIGGSCMMLGEDSGIREEGSFASKSVAARISVILAGPIFNFILAYILAAVIISIAGYDPATIVSVTEGSPAAEAGLMEGDLVKKINGRNVSISRDLDMYFTYEGYGDEPIRMTVERDGQRQELSFDAYTVNRYMLGISYYADENEAAVNALEEGGMMEAAGMVVGDVIVRIDGTGIETGADLGNYFSENSLTGDPLEVAFLHNGEESVVTVEPPMTEYTTLGFVNNPYREDASPLQILKYSAVEVRYWISATLNGLGKLVTGQLSMDSLSGPVGVVSVIGETYEASKESGSLYVVLNMMNLSILLSANLGVMNLLPLPALDGGRFIFLLLEGIRRKPIDQEKEGMVHFVGFVLLMLLMVVVLFNDIKRLF